MKQTTQLNSVWHQMVSEKLARRSVLKNFLIAGTAAAAAPLLKSEAATARTTEAATLPKVTTADEAAAVPFEPIGPSAEDALLLPEGFEYNVVAEWGQEIGGDQKIGFNHDWVGFYPIDLLEKGTDATKVYNGFLPDGTSSSEGLLVINHEYVNPLFVSGYSSRTEAKTAEEVDLELDEIGMSVVRVTMDDAGQWTIVPDAPENRRLTARTPMVLTGPAANIDGGPEAIGTLGNCSGGVTPWGTALSCEENFQGYPKASPRGAGWDPLTYGNNTMAGL